MKEHLRRIKWKVKAEAKDFGKKFYGYLLHIIGGAPVCIMGFENTGTPYSSQIYNMLEKKHPDIKLSKLGVSGGEITGFQKEYVENRKLIVFTENRGDRGGVYAADIARKYMQLKEPYNIKGLTFVTINPFWTMPAEKVLSKGFI